MLSIRIPLALIIVVALSLVAYFAEQSLSSMLGAFTTPFFVVLTFVLMYLPSLFSAGASSSETRAPRPAQKSAVDADADAGTLYVGNLSYKANEQDVESLFAGVGTVKSVRLVKDRKTNRRKGFGFVEIDAAQESQFIAKLNDTEFMDRTIKVRPAKEKS